MNKGEFNVGSIKKMKDKVVITLENPSITITFKSNDDNNTNFDFMELLINKI
jgi:hypothetical protein